MDSGRILAVRWEPRGLGIGAPELGLLVFVTILDPLVNTLALIQAIDGAGVLSVSVSAVCTKPAPRVGNL